MNNPTPFPNTDSTPSPFSSKLNRRSFLTTVAKSAVIAGFPAIIPASVLGRGNGVLPSERVTLGLIGCGSIAKGQANYPEGLAQYLAVCDVRPERAKAFSEKFGGCDIIEDFRELLAREDIDAVHISTPDHWHVPMAILAAEAGKHMNVEKPLSLSVGGISALDKALKGKNLHFQFNAENRANRKCAHAIDLLANGYLGTISEAYVWGPNGASGSFRELPPQPVPDGLNWDLWQGPAPERPFHPRLLTAASIWHLHDYSRGMMANWGIHPINLYQWWADVAGQGVPVAYRGKVDMNPDPNYNNAQSWDVEMEHANGFKARFLSADIAEAQQIPGFRGDVNYPKHGITWIGEKGWMSLDITNGPLASFADYPTIMRTKNPNGAAGSLIRPGTINADLIHSIRGGEATLNNWKATLRCDMIPILVDLLGRTGQEVRWDPERMEVTSPGADSHIIREMREPWHSITYKYLKA